MTRRAVVPKSNTVTGVIGPVHGKNRFHYLGIEKAEMREICKFILMSDYFSSVFFGSSLSNRGVKSKNEFAAMENQCNTGVGHLTTICRKISIFAGAQKSKFLLRHILS